MKQQNMGEATGVAAKTTMQKSSDKPRPVNSTYQLKKLEQIEEEIDRMEETVKEIEEKMSLYNTDAYRLKELFEERENVNKALELAYEMWGTNQPQMDIK